MVILICHQKSDNITEFSKHKRMFEGNELQDYQRFGQNAPLLQHGDECPLILLLRQKT